MATAKVGSKADIDRVEVKVYTVPTEIPESDGTLKWGSTTMVLVNVSAVGEVGLGYTYSDAAAAKIIHGHLMNRLKGQDAMSISGCWEKMVRAVRNLGDSGICMMAISAVDNALWDLKAKLLNLPLVTLLGKVREQVPIYGSGGFTSYTLKQLGAQLSGWASQDISNVKMKIGRAPDEDPERIRFARDAVGPNVGLFVDANGAYDRKQAMAMAETLARYDVIWFEEPVYHRDRDGLRLLRDRAPASMEITAGEYGFQPAYFRRLIESDAVDVLQADVTRCGGVTGFMLAATLCRANYLPMSSHCAPSIHLHPCCALEPVRHMEYFHDHVRIENMLFDGAPSPRSGSLRPDLSRPGMGLELKKADAQRFEV